MGEFILQVIKRDKTKVEFDRNKISDAIYRAMKFGSGLVDTEVSTKIAEDCENFFRKVKRIPTVESIEDFVYRSLIEHDHMETARAYEGYRAVQEFKRGIYVYPY